MLVFVTDEDEDNGSLVFLVLGVRFLEAFLQNGILLKSLAINFLLV